MKIKVKKKWGRLSVGLVCEVPSHTAMIMISRGYAERVVGGNKTAKPQLERLRKKRKKKADDSSVEAKVSEG